MTDAGTASYREVRDSKQQPNRSEECPMLTFIHTPALTMSLGLKTFDEDLRESRRGRRTAGRRPRATRTDDRTVSVSGRPRWWLARALRPAH
jgi:hypothetical protein